jgi:hypothetical protein
VLVSFKAEIVAGLKVEGYNFADVVKNACAGAEARFSDGAQEAVVAPHGSGRNPGCCGRTSGQLLTS